MLPATWPPLVCAFDRPHDKVMNLASTQGYNPFLETSRLPALLLVCSAGSAETLTERRVSSGDIGTLVFMAPEKWKGVEGYDESRMPASRCRMTR
jgi:hypothetical protein